MVGRVVGSEDLSAPTGRCRNDGEVNRPSIEYTVGTGSGFQPLYRVGYRSDESAARKLIIPEHDRHLTVEVVTVNTKTDRIAGVHFVVHRFGFW